MEDPATAKEAPPKLDTIPIEVVYLIIEILTLDIHTPYPEGGSPDRCAEKDGIAREVLRDMCLVSKRIGSAASRYLYRHICLRDPSTVVLLFRSLVRNPELGTRIKRISYDIHCYNHIMPNLEPLRSIEGHGWTCYLNEVLARISSLQWLEFSLPSPRGTYMRPGFSGPPPPDPHIPSSGVPHDSWMYRRAPDASGPQRLHMIGNRAFPSAFEEEPERPFKKFLDQCKVQHLMWSMDYNAWFGFLKNPDEVHIKLLKEDPEALETDNKLISDALAGLTDLHTLSLDLHYGQDISKTLGPSGVLDLTALSNLHTLEVPIRFLIQKQYGVEEDSGNEGDSGEGNTGVANAENFLCPAAVLPKSLQRLTLLTDVRCLENVDEEEATESIYKHRFIVLDFLDAFSSTCKENFPHLRKVCYRQGVEGADECACTRDPTPPHLPFPFYPQEGDLDGCLARLEDISDSFRRNGVEFKGVARSNPCLRLEPHVGL
ncbi:hypothetical protein VMCG_07052 [Cytospora schulzeri]|uniref:F-box domain-containing protein n=1 Tax=Cytospora schulzeri TaxID=448051 RepID=A0A423W422_9PEZI|nr:hypothetical protein VMCG_07052 [Valsa malicola]